MIFPFVFAAAVAASSASATASARPAASAAPSASAAASAQAPLPAGHPHVDRGEPHRANLFQPPADVSDEDPKVPVGTIRVELRDPFDHPLPHHAVQLGIVKQSIAKGDTHEHKEMSTDESGVAVFSDLDTASEVAYRVTAHAEDASFGARPFRLGKDKGIHVVLHVYPVMHDLLSSAQIGARAIMYVEVKGDRVQIQERLDIFNGTPLAWVPHDLVLKLPENFTALNGMQQMSDIGVDPVSGQGARLHGTFVPGENMVMFSWQIPYGDTQDVELEVGMPPDVRQAIVRAAAAPGMKLEVPGFREAVPQVNEEGQRELDTGKQLNDNEPPIRSIHVALRDLPTPGPSRLVATVLAALAIASGIYLATQRRTRSTSKSAAKRDRERVLEEIDQLEVAHEHGEVGPKTYERARRELIDELATLLATAK